MFRDLLAPGRAVSVGVFLLGTALQACACLPTGTSLRVTLVDSTHLPVEDAVVSCRPSGSTAERATQVDRGVYDCGTGQGIFFLDIHWHGSLIVWLRVDIFGDSGNCGSLPHPIGLSFTLARAAGDGGPAADAAPDAGRD